MTYYHVCQSWDGGDLLSLARRMRSESAAMDAYLERWPEAGDLAVYHVHYVHLYPSLAAAQEHAEAFGGDVLAIDDRDDCLEIQTDELEFDHPVCRGPVPAACITRV